MGFWIRHIIFGIVLLGLAAWLLSNQEELFSSATAPSSQSSGSGSNTNKAAEGLSSFYASINPDMDEQKGPEIRNNVVFLPEPSGNVDNIIEDRGQVVRPLKKRWKGTTEARPFRKGETLFQKLSEYAGKEGIEVIWDLNRDLVIKDAFRVNKTIVDTALQVGTAISGHFENGVKVFFCHRQRAIVLTDEASEQLIQTCQLLENKDKL